MMKKWKTPLMILVLLCAMAAFIFYPSMYTDLHIKVYFDPESIPTQCSLYYTTTESPDFSNIKLIYAEHTGNVADLVLPKELHSNLQAIRLDFDQSDTVQIIDRIDLCSGGFIQKSFDAADFFCNDNILLTNDISSLYQGIYPVFFLASGPDPYIVFQPEAAALCNEAYSHYTITKALICLFILSSLLLARKNFFITD